MQNGHEALELFKATARACKSDPSRSCTLREHVRFSLLVQGKQAISRKEYRRALICKQLCQIVERSKSIKEAFIHLEELIANGHSPSQQTPVSNTGVTEPAAAVPIDYFTGGK